MSDSRTGRWTVVINQTAGSGLSDSKGSIESVRELFRERGIETQVYLVLGPEVENTIREALKEGSKGIVVGGGDGTLSTAAGVMANGEVPLGVLPLGTLNHFAKLLGIPADLAAAVDVIVEGCIRRIDLGEVNGCHFINNSSIGAYPQVIRFRDHQRRHFGRNKWVAFALAFFRFLRRYRTMEVALQIDGRTLVRKTPFVFVGNNEYRLDEAFIATRCNLAAGCLCVYTARCDHWMQFLRLFALLLVNRLAEAPEFEMYSVSQLCIRTRHRTHDVSRDGEVYKMEMPLSYRIHSGALAVFVPHQTSM